MPKFLSCPTVVKGNPKVPFSLTTILRSRGGHYSFLWIAPLTLDSYLIMLHVKEASSIIFFGVFHMTQPEIEPGSPRSLASTLTIMPPP